MRFVVALLLVVGMVTVVGCTAAGEQTTARTESTAAEKATTGEAVAHSTQPPQNPQGEASEAKTQMQANDANDGDGHILHCQVDEAAQDNGKDTKQGQFIDEVYQESRQRGVYPEQVLSERGYDCGWSALQQSKGKG